LDIGCCFNGFAVVVKKKVGEITRNAVEKPGIA
jgi:hypothetical protein